MRWLHEQAKVLTQNLLRSGAGQKRSRAIYQLRLEAVKTSLNVIVELGKLTNAKAHMAPHVVIPRWKEVIGKIMDCLKDIPEARAALSKVVKEEGPQDSPVYVKGEKARKEESVEQIALPGNEADRETQSSQLRA